MYFVYNGNFYPGEEKIISPDNRSFKYGDGFFETMKMIDGRLIFGDLHFERLFSSLQTMQFDTPEFFTKDYFLQQIRELVIKNKHPSLARIRLSIFRGDGNLYDENNHPDYIIQSWGLPSFPRYNEQGFAVDIYREARIACDAFSNIKSNNYLPYAMAAIWCKKKSVNDALVVNTYNRIAEATTSNIFIVKNGLIQTPSLSEGCIAGVTRRYLLRCFEEENIACEQGSLTEEDIFSADEIFLTNTGFYMQWIKQYGNKSYTNESSKHLYQRFISPILK